MAAVGILCLLRRKCRGCYCDWRYRRRIYHSHYYDSSTDDTFTWRYFTIQHSIHEFKLITFLYTHLFCLVCGGNFSEPSGVFSSPNYPNPYGNNEICGYTIRVADGNRIVLNFLEFNTESGADYVTVLYTILKLTDFIKSNHNFTISYWKQVYDGLTTTSPMLVRASGLSTDLLTTSSGSGCLVVHTSDGANSSKGWSATYATA